MSGNKSILKSAYRDCYLMEKKRKKCMQDLIKCRTYIFVLQSARNNVIVVKQIILVFYKIN